MAWGGLCEEAAAKAQFKLLRHKGMPPGRIIEGLRITSVRADTDPRKATVKKTFKLAVEGKNRDRVLDAIKHDIRKYVKRQRRVPLPEGVDFWDFDCRFGLSEAQAEPVHFATIIALVDAAAKDGADSFYLELLAKTGHRTARPRPMDEAGGEADAQPSEPNA